MRRRAVYRMIPPWFWDTNSIVGLRPCRAVITRRTRNTTHAEAVKESEVVSLSSSVVTPDGLEFEFLSQLCGG
jgi:hypothetical protein